MQATGTRTRCLMTMVIIIIALMPGLVTSSSLTNVALRKPAAQSSDINGEDTASKAVDGDYVSIQHTALVGNEHWLLVDLKGFYNISSVRITTRVDCCGERLKNFDINFLLLNPMKVGSAQRLLCHHYSGAMLTHTTVNFPCDQPITGRYVRVSMPNVGGQLHIAELEVMATTSASTDRKYVPTKGHKVAGDMIQEVTSRSVTECLTWCSSDAMCNAVNMGLKTSAGRGTVCQLLSFGGIGQPDSTTPDPDWDFYSIGYM